MRGFDRLILQFFIYAFLGWFLESLFKSFKFKEIINSGFLKGPLVPVYGFGAVVMLGLDYWAFESLHLGIRLMIYTATATIIEYYTGLFLEETVHVKLWDYSDLPLNIKGRVCLLHSFFWTLLSFGVLIFVQPRVVFALETIPAVYSRGIAVVLIIYSLADLLYSITLLERSRLWLDRLKTQAVIQGEYSRKIFYSLPEIGKKAGYTIKECDREIDRRLSG